ncbi:EAL domain-containing protein [Mycobacterium sp. RTGN5]|uniref:EAL domain-containing protein n=1 Tax=Mycobacterium sp. RTGN5 TaxID=3016522 RepID=UPI0029C7A5BA|nr:EAL domain-containing protein [Mycobacterium sp. RTGN5]
MNIDAAGSSDGGESAITIDGAGVILTFDGNAEKAFGYCADEVIGKNVRMLMPEPYRSRHDGYLADYIRTGEAHIIGIGRRVTATRKDGSDFPVQLSVTEIKIGGAQAFIGIVRDITAQAAAELDSRLALDAASKIVAALTSERNVADAQHRLLADNAVDIVAHLRGREVAWVSPSVEAAFGWPRERWIGVDFPSRIHPDDLDAVPGVLRDVAAGRSGTARVRIQAADGGYHWVVVGGKPYIDVEGNTDGTIFAGRIIDQQVAAEQQLTASRMRFEAVITNMPSAISVCDLQLRYTLVNPAFCRLFGQKSVADVIGRTKDEILPRDVLASTRRAVDRLLAGEHFFQEESINVGPDNILVITQQFPLRDSAGDISELVTIRTDITHRRQAEQTAAERAMWEERVRAAIGGDRVLVYSLPIVNISTREVVDEELLIRARHSQTGEILSPDKFLPHCERHGLMSVIDQYMVARAIDLACTGRRVSVNITGDTIGDATAMVEILQALAAAGPTVTDKIMFEITETTALASPAIAKTFSLAMRNLGCRVALDDFGTGYGTLTDLRLLDLYALKIDQSFVKNILQDRDDERVVSTISFIARTYGLTTIAEGVESEEILEKLAAMGIDRAQGYVFGHPAPVT